MQQAIESSGTEMITVALRRVNLTNPDDHILNHLNLKHCQLLPNTSGAQTADEAIRLAMLSRASSQTNWIKLEVTPEPRHLIPDGEETLKATKILVKEGFIVLPYMQADPILAKKLEDAGAATVMPLASPIGSNKGLKNKDLLKIIIENANIPVVIDAGIGAPSHACEAMELGADAILVNTAIAIANFPILIASAFKKAVEAGREGYLSGLAKENEGEASSPLGWLIK
jgi:thiazole synthase